VDAPGGGSVSTSAVVVSATGRTLSVDAGRISAGRIGTRTGRSVLRAMQTAEQTADRPVIEPVIELHDAVAVLGGFPALAGASLTIRRGEIVLLQGPNGAGKTTLLRLCAGLLPLARGEGRILGHDLRHDRLAVRPRVGLLGHSNGLYADLTVAENVGFWGATVGAGSGEIDAALERLGVSGRLADVPTRRLSAGQRRRTALACLVARRAELWLLDEPHAGLDAAGRDDLDATLREAVAAGATVVVASHELERAGTLASRRVDVVAGQIVEAP
jgi:heme ABC exporter ATP-binding subunit CcmA